MSTTDPHQPTFQTDTWGEADITQKWQRAISFWAAPATITMEGSSERLKTPQWHVSLILTVPIEYPILTIHNHW